MLTLRRSLWLCVLLSSCFLLSTITQGQTTFTWTGAINNNWNNSGNWTKAGPSTSSFPNQNAGQDDQAIINSGTPVVNASFTNNSLTAVTITAPGTLSLTANNTITVSGSITGSGSFTQTNGTVNVSGDLTLATVSLTGGTINYNGASMQLVKGATYSALTFSAAGSKTISGPITVNGTFTTACDIDQNGSAMTFLGGVTRTAGSIIAGGDDVTYNSGSAQAVLAGSITSLTKSGTGTATLTGNITSSGGISITAGTLAISTFSLSGTTLSGAGTFTATTGSLTLSGNNTHSGTFTPGTGTVVYNGGSAQTVRGTTYNNLTFSGAGTKTLGAALIVGATFNTASNIDQSGFAMTFNGAVTRTAGSITAGGNAVTYNATVGQDVLAGSITSLTKSGSGTATLSGPVTCSGAISVTAGTLSLTGFDLSGTNLSGAGALNGGSAELTLSGNNTHSGTFTAGTGTVVYNGSGTQTVRGTTYNNLTFSGAGTKNIGAAMTVNGTFTTASNINQGGFAMVFNGPVSWTAGTIAAGGNALTYSSSSNQDVLSGSITTFTKSGTGTATLTGNLTCSGAITLTAGTLDLNTSFNLSGTTLSGAGTLTAGSGTISLTGNNTHSGTFNAGTSTMVYNVNATQSIQGYGATGYYNLTISNANTKTIQNTLLVTNVFLYNGTGTLSTLSNNNVSFNHFNQTAGTVSFGNGAYSFSGNFHKTGGTFTSGTGTVAFSGTGFVRSNSAISFPSGGSAVSGVRTISGAGTVTLSAVSVAGTLSNKINLIVGGSLSGAGTFSNDSTAAILDVNFGGAGPSVSNFTVNTAGTVRYGFAGAQTTRSAAYFNLATATSGTKTISVGTTIANDLILGSPTDCAFNLTIPGNVTGTSSFNLTGSSTLSVTGNYLATGALTIAGAGALNVGGNLNTGGGTLSFNASAVSITGSTSGTGPIGFSTGGSFNITGNYGHTGNLTMAGTGTFTAGGNVSHGGGNLVFNTSNVTIAGTLNGTGGVTFSGAGTLEFTGPGGWTSTTGTFTSPTTGVTYSASSGSQTVRAVTYAHLTLTGASAKNLGTGAGGAVNGVFDIQAGQTLAFPITAATLALNGSVTGTGRILGDPAGTLTVGTTGGATTSLGTLYFDTTKAMGTINFNRDWNRALQVKIGSSVRLINYTFAGPFTVGGVEIADNEVFKLEPTVVTPASILHPNVGRLRYFMLGTNARFVFQPTGVIPAGTNLTFPIGPSPNAGTPWQLLEGNANGSLNAAVIGATTINGTGTNFDDQILVGYNLYLSNGTLVGEIASYVSATQITLRAPGSLVNISAGSTFKLIQAYRPVSIIPSASVSGGSIEVSIQNHTGGGITSATNIPNVPSNRRLNYIFKVRATPGFPNCGIWTEGLISNDFNATIDDAKYSFFRWSGTFWVKLAADLVGPGAVPSNTQIRRNSVVMPGVQTYILGQTGGVLPDDPTFSWTGGAGNNNWKQAGNWNVFPSGAGNWPDDIGHNVIIDAGGVGNPVISSGDSINVKHIVHNGKRLTIENNGVLNIVGNYSYNQPTLSGAGIGRLIQSGTAVTGTNGSQFLTQLSPGSLLYTTEGGFIGAVRSVASNSALTLQAIGGGGNINIPDSSTFNFINPSIAPGGGNLTCATGTNVVTGTGFTSALNGRMLYTGANVLQGTVAYVQSPTSLLLVNNAYNTVTNQPYSVSSLVVPSGSATTDFQTGSSVNYSSSLADQTIAATSYSILNFIDSRVGATTDIARYVNCPGQTITIRTRFRARVHVKPAASLGPVWQFQNNSRMSLIYPSGTLTLSGYWTNFSLNGVAGAYNVKWGTLPTDRIHFDGYFQGLGTYSFPAMELEIGSRFGDFSLVNTTATGRWRLPLGANITVNGSFNLSNTSGPTNDVLILGTNTANPVTSLTLLGPVSGLNNLVNSAATVHLANLTIGGTGSVSGDLFESVSQLRNLTINRPGASLTLSGAQALTVSEKITLTNGTFGHTGTGTITAGSAAISGIDVNGGNLTLSGSSNLSLVSNGGLTINGGNANLSNTGSVSVAGNFTQTGGSFSRITHPSTFQGNFSVTGGNINLTGSTVSFTGANAQSLTGPASGFSFANLTINKTGGAVTAIGGKVNVTGTISLPVSNTAAFNTGTGNVTLVSNALGTARIAAIAGGSIGGNNWTMERFVNGGIQGWYFLGTPVKTQALGNWGDDFDITTPLTCPGTLTDIMDRNTVFRLAGDAVPANGPNPNEANGWRAPSACGLTNGEGYRVFLKNNFFATGGATVRNTGELNSGPTPLPVTYNPSGYSGGGWNLVANPLPSNIDWDAPGGWTKTNLTASMYIWKGASNQYGSYTTGIGGVNGVDNIIPSGQAFLVKAIGAPALTVNETAKSSTAKSMYRTSVAFPLVRILLEGAGGGSDEMIVHFKEGSTDLFDADFDASKMENPGLNLYSHLDGEKYAINGLAPVESDKILPLGIALNGNGNQKFRFSGLGSLDAGTTVLLKDNYLNQIMEVNDGQVVSFNTTSDPASFGESRFELIFSVGSVTGTTIQKSLELKIYPNPAKDGKVTIETSITQGLAEVMDVLGRKVAQKDISAQGSKAQWSMVLPTGLYTVKVTGTNGQVHSKKLVVE